MWKAKVFLSDYANMCHTHLSGFSADKLAACFTFLKLFMRWIYLIMEVDQIRAEDGTFQNCTVNNS